MSASSGDAGLALPKTFVLELTRRCNHRCLYCYTSWQAPELAYPSNGHENSLAEVKELILRLQEQAPVENIALSGGEPLLREDIAEIVDFLRQRDIAPVLITNGARLSPEIVDATREETTYEVTLLSHRKEIHDRLAGVPGSWDDAVRGMANVRHARGSLVAVFIATKLNYMDLHRTAELAIALGADGMMYNRINLGAANMHLADALLPTPAMIEENLATLVELRRQYGLVVAISVVIEPCVIDVSKYPTLHFGWCPLAGPDSYFTFDPAGNIRICNHSPTVLGNINRDDFREIYYHHPYVQAFRDTWPAECADCDPKLKAMCGGGCKAAAEQCYGTLARVDPFVVLNRSH